MLARQGALALERVAGRAGPLDVGRGATPAPAALLAEQAMREAGLEPAP